MKNSRALNLLIISNIISGFSQGISMLAVPWYFVSILKMPQGLTIMYMSMLIGSIFWGLYSGALIDKYSRKNLFLFFSLICGVIMCSAAITGYVLSYVPTFMVVTVFFATCYFNGVYYPAMYAFAQEISDASHYGKVNSLLEIQSQAITIASGGVAALLLQGIDVNSIHLAGINIPIAVHIAPWGLSRIFMVDGITYFIAIALIWFIKYTPHTATHTEEGSVWERLKTGNNFLKAHRLILIFGVGSFSIFVFLLLHFNTLVPIFVVNHLRSGVTTFALTDVYYAIGALLAGVWIRKIFNKVSAIWAIMLMTAAIALFLLICSLSTSIFVYFAFSFILGITNAGTRILRITYLFHHIPNHLAGRVNSVLFMLGTLCRIGLAMIFSFAFFSQGDNIVWAYIICVVFLLVNLGLMIYAYKGLKIKYPDPAVQVA